MSNIQWLKAALTAFGLLLCVTSQAQIVNAFADWKAFAGGDINQGGNGPCEYITRTWAVEYAVRMYYRDPASAFGNPDINLSEQHIWQRCFQYLPEYTPACLESEGIQAPCMAQFITDHGIANEACLPAEVNASGISQYNRCLVAVNATGQNVCERNNEPLDACIDPCIDAPQADRFRFRAPLEYATQASTLGIHSNDDLKKAIIRYGPHSLYFNPEPFSSGEHAILIVGWTSTGKWIFKNSSTQYFMGKGVTGFGELAFNIPSTVKVGRVIGLPECEGFACSNFARRSPDYDGDGFCSIKWGNLPAGVNCKGHDADDNNATKGPYTDYGYITQLKSGSTVTLNSAYTDPLLVRATGKILLSPGFRYTAQDGGRTFTAFIGSSF